MLFRKPLHGIEQDGHIAPPFLILLDRQECSHCVWLWFWKALRVKCWPANFDWKNILIVHHNSGKFVLNFSSLCAYATNQSSGSAQIKFTSCSVINVAQGSLLRNYTQLSHPGGEGTYDQGGPCKRYKAQIKIFSHPPWTVEASFQMQALVV